MMHKDLFIAKAQLKMLERNYNHAKKAYENCLNRIDVLEIKYAEPEIPLTIKREKKSG